MFQQKGVFYYLSQLFLYKKDNRENTTLEHNPVYTEFKLNNILHYNIWTASDNYVIGVYTALWHFILCTQTSRKTVYSTWFPSSYRETKI